MAVINQLPHAGAPSETLLWQNPNTTTSFSEQDVTLSQPASNFTALKFDYIFNTGSQNYSTSVYYLMDDPSRFASGNSHLRMNLGGINSSGAIFNRACYFSDSTYEKVYIPLATRDTSASSTSATNSIPVAIYGVS